MKIPGVYHIKQIDKIDYKDFILVNISEVEQKVMFIKIGNTSYLCIIPNNVEM